MIGKFLFPSRATTLATVIARPEAEFRRIDELPSVLERIGQTVGSRVTDSLTNWLPLTSRKSERRRQLDEMLTEQDKVGRHREQHVLNQRIGIAITSLGCASLSFLFWPLRLISLSSNVYLTLHLYQKTYRLLQKRKVGIPTLMVISITGAMLCGYIWAASLILVIVQFTHKLLAEVMSDSRNNLVNVFRQVPKQAWVVSGDIEVQIPVDQIVPGQIVMVSAGEMIPVDGLVVSGMATVDQHLLTGEAQPVEKGETDTVLAGTVLHSGKLQIQVDKAGSQTTMARLGEILNATTDYKSSAQLRAEDLADKTVGPTLIAGLLALPFIGPMGALTVIDSHFRQRMSVLAPLSLMNYLNLASRQGILVKDGRSIDLMAQVDTVVFDKTGTLTEERPTVHRIHACHGYTTTEILCYAAAAEQKQSHPIAHAILDEARCLQIDIPVFQEADYKLGYGLTVTVDDHLIQVGSVRFMEYLEIALVPELIDALQETTKTGHSLVMIAIDGQIAGAIELEPTVRAEAGRIIQELRNQYGIRSICIISGDHRVPTQRMAEQLGIDTYFAETLPEQKADLIDKLVSEGRKVCYIGDGINDAIALKKAHVSISLRGASSVATDTAQVILMDGHLCQLPSLFDFARSFHKNSNRAFAISVIPSVIGIWGALFLHFTLVNTALLTVGSLCVGIGNSMLPLLQYRSKGSALEQANNKN